MGEKRLHGPQAHRLAVEVTSIDADCLQRQIGAPRDPRRERLFALELIREPAQLILAGVPVAEGEPCPVLATLLHPHQGEIVRQPVRIEEALLSVRIEMGGILTPLPKPQRRQLRDGLAASGQYPRRGRLERNPYAIHRPPPVRSRSGGTMFARASSSARSASLRRCSRRARDATRRSPAHPPRGWTSRYRPGT